MDLCKDVGGREFQDEERGCMQSWTGRKESVRGHQKIEYGASVIYSKNDGSPLESIEDGRLIDHDEIDLHFSE